MNDSLNISLFNATRDVSAFKVIDLEVPFVVENENKVMQLIHFLPLTSDINTSKLVSWNLDLLNVSAISLVASRFLETCYKLYTHLWWQVHHYHDERILPIMMWDLDML